MQTPTLTIFANFRIHHEERLLRMKDSFLSFKDICAQKWVINVRGQYREQVADFLREQLGDRLVLSFLESKQGWFYDTRQMLPHIDTDYVLFWIEDHLNLADTKVYPPILTEMKASGTDVLWYSWFHPKVFAPIQSIKGKKLDLITTYHLTKASVKFIEKKIHSAFHTVPAQSIFKVSFFKKLVTTNHPLIKKWPKNCPFDMEKISSDIEFLPLAGAFPNQELFTSIDAGPTQEYSLIGRGLYPDRVRREELLYLDGRDGHHHPLKKFFPKKMWQILSWGYTWLRRIRYTLNI